MLKKVRYLALFLTGIILAFTAGWQLNNHYSGFDWQPTSSAADKITQSDLFDEVYQLLDQLYLDQDQVDNERLLYGSIEGMVASLGDPYTVFLPPEDNEQFKEDMSGSFDGVGIELGYKDNQLAVVAPLQDSPAERAGVSAGDLIIHIKDDNKGIDQDSYDISSAEAVELIRGDRGTTVTLTLVRDGVDEPIKVDIIRDEIIIPRVSLETISRNGQTIAYVKLSRFGDNTIDQWDEVVGQIEELKKANNFTGMVLDLRNNPGGYLEGAIYVASEFINQGVIVQQEDNQGNRQSFSANHQGKLTQTPLVVLVNEGSASAAEIVAGALKEQKSIPIVGQTTFGKGTIQQSEELDNNSSLHVTIARWLLPSGAEIHQKGISPDIEIDDDSQTATDEILEAGINKLINL